MRAILPCGNRNLRFLTAAAKIVAMFTEGRMYLAASEISSIGSGRVPLISDRVKAFATALGILDPDLAAITGVELREPPRPEDRLAAEMTGLLSNCRQQPRSDWCVTKLNRCS